VNAQDIRRRYRDDLHDPRWLEFRDAIVAERGICWCCGTDRSLQVHHLVYYRNRRAWEYYDHEVRVLCEECHEAVHQVANLIWVSCLKFEPHVLELILKALPSPRPDIAIRAESSRAGL